MTNKFDDVIKKSFLTQLGEIINEQAPMDPAMAPPPGGDPAMAAPPGGDPAMAAPPAPVEPEVNDSSQKISLVNLAVRALKFNRELEPGELSLFDQQITDDNVDDIINTINSVITRGEDVNTQPVRYNKAT